MNYNYQKLPEDEKAFKTQPYGQQGYQQSSYPTLGTSPTEITINYTIPTQPNLYQTQQYQQPYVQQQQQQQITQSVNLENKATDNQSAGPVIRYNQYYGNTDHIKKKEEPKGYSFHKKHIENTVIKRSEIVGNLLPGHVEFDDYFQLHIEKFFTVEVDEVHVYHHDGYIYGMQFIYRDSFGIKDKETFKGGLHMPKNYTKDQFSCAKLTLASDEFIKECYVDGYEYISFIKMVTNKGKEITVGQQLTQGALTNLLPFGVKLNGIGGVVSGCINAFYCYYI